MKNINIGLDGIVTVSGTDDPLTSSELKSLGKDYNGYQVPLDKDAQDTVVAIMVQILAGAFTGTTAEFSNGTKMPILANEGMAFVLWFKDERNAFFID